MNCEQLLQIICNADIPLALRVDAQTLLHFINPLFITNLER